MFVQHSKQKNAQIIQMMLHDRIAAAMKHAKLTPKMMVDKTGLSKGAISFWLTGKTKNLKSESALSIAKATGVNAEWLITGVGDMLHARPLNMPALSDLSTKELKADGQPLSPDAVKVAQIFDLMRGDLDASESVFAAQEAVMQSLMLLHKKRLSKA